MAESTRMDGKICLLTGATRGIGRATATELARRGATIVLVARDPSRAEEVANDLRTRTGNPNVSFLLADLSEMASVRKLASEFREKHSALHVLLNNAGAIFESRQVTSEGIERTFALDHLAYFLLTVELLDLLKASAPARVVSVSSDAHLGGRMHFDDLQLEKGYSGWRAYNQAKLANILFTSELARRLEGTSVTANCLHPGVVASGFGHNNTGPIRWLFKLGGPFILSPEKGARTAIWLSTAPEIAEVSGKYFFRKRQRTPSKAARDPEAAKKLWAMSEQLVGLGPGQVSAEAAEPA